MQEHNNNEVHHMETKPSEAGCGSEEQNSNEINFHL